MLTVHIWYHIDGDKLAIVDTPWWQSGYEWLVNRFCPCCGLSGWLIEKISEKAKEGSVAEKFYLKYYNRWSKIYLWSTKFEKNLYEVPIPDACEASLRIFKKKSSCFRENCEHCWELREDAMKWELREDAMKVVQRWWGKLGIKSRSLG